MKDAMEPNEANENKAMIACSGRLPAVKTGRVPAAEKTRSAARGSGLLLTAAAVLRNNEPYRHPEPKAAAAAPAQEDGCLPAGGTAFMQPEYFVNEEDMLYDTPDEYL